MRFAVALLLALGLADPPPPGTGDRAPDLNAETLDGHPVRLDGRVTIVSFFATWCGPCHRALADLAALKLSPESRPRIILVSVRESALDVKRFVGSSPVPAGAEVATDLRGATAAAWGQDRFPTTYLVDASGVIRHINRGWGPGYGARVTRWLRAMLAVNTAPTP